MSATILLVDDEPRVTQALKRLLRRSSLEVFTASSGQEALKILATEDIDVLVSDEQMPLMSGSELLAIAAKEYPSTIRMILSGQATLEAAVRAINEGRVHRFFIKPCNEHDLLQGIQHFLEFRQLSAENRQLREVIEARDAALARLERDMPGISELEEDEDGAVLIDMSDL